MLTSLVLVLLSICLLESQGDEMICTVNGKRALHRINERFLSISVDPAVLLTGLNLSDISLEMLQHLSPAFVRIAGPSTEFLKYFDDFENDLDDYNDDGKSLLVTGSMWYGINEWMSSANLTPIFAVNDAETIKDVWNPKSTLPLLEISDKFNVSCYWQLGYDSSNKTESRYKKDLFIFQHILDAFPERKDSWKIVGSDITTCAHNHLDHTDHARKTLDGLHNILESVVIDKSIGNELISRKLLSSPIKPKVPLWIALPKNNQPITFSSAITYAKEIGEAAKTGYEVIFRQPRLHEFYSDTPVYWVTTLFNHLMGRTVLEVKSTTHYSDVSVFAHCTKNQNTFVRSGAMTVLIVNNATENHTVLLKFGTSLLKNTEVQSYIFTSNSDDSGDIYLNNQKLDMEFLKNLHFIPKLRRAKMINYLPLNIPAKSIGFFVFPVAHLPICSHDEDDLRSLMDEINHDQAIPFGEEIDLTPRSFAPRSTTLRDLQDVLAKELEFDKSYYNKFRPRAKNDHMDYDEARNFFIKRAKLVENQRRQLDDQIEVKRPKIKSKPVPEPEPVRELELELTSSEIRKILADRAKKQAAKKNVVFTSEELDEIMEKATAKFLENTNTQIKIVRKVKRSADATNQRKDSTRGKKDINMKLLKMKTLGTEHRDWLKNLLQSKHKKQEDRPKRDINMSLLKTKTNSNPNQKSAAFHSFEDKQATIRRSDQTSAELLNYDEMDSKEEEDIPGEVFAELATDYSTTTEKFPLFNQKNFKLPTLPLPVAPTKPPRTFLHDHKFLPSKPHISKLFQESKILDNHPKIEEDPDLFDFDLDQENFSDQDCIHEFFGHQIKKIKTEPLPAPVQPKKEERCEFGELIMKEKEKNDVPEMKNRHADIYEMEHLDLTADYGDLDSSEAKPLRFKRSNNEIDREIPLKPHQVRMLKNRLSHRKRMNFINKNWQKKHEEILENGRKARSVFHKYRSSILDAFTKARKLKGASAGKEKREAIYELEPIGNEIDFDPEPKLSNKLYDLDKSRHVEIFKEQTTTIPTISLKKTTTTPKEKEEISTESGKKVHETCVVQKIPDQQNSFSAQKLSSELKEYLKRLGDKLKELVMRLLK